MHLPILSPPHNCTKKKNPSVGVLPPASHFLSARLFSAAPVTHSRSHSGVSPGCTNSFTPIFYSAFHYNLLLLLRLHYHINYRLSHTCWFPLVSHLHQVDNASTSLNYSADNLNQREPIHILNARLLLAAAPARGASTRGSLHPLDVCVCLPPVQKIHCRFYKEARDAFINQIPANYDTCTDTF